MSEFTDKFKEDFGLEFIPKFAYDYSYNLLTVYYEYFDEWWDPEEFDWFWSEFLAEYCSSEFDKWWNKKKFDWDYYKSLIDYCSSDILTWFDKEKVDYRYLDPCSIVLLKKHGKL